MTKAEDFHIAVNYRQNAVWIKLGDLPRKLIAPGEARALAEEIEAEMGGASFGDAFDAPADIAAGLREAATEAEEERDE